MISGKLAFEPGAGTPIGDNAIGADQFQGLGLVIDGVEFGSSSYNIRVINDTAFDDTESEGQLDTMTIRCSPSDPQPCTPALISLQGGDPFAITERLELVGDSDILDSATVSSERDIWNSFTLRRALAVTFDNATGGSMLLRANVGQFEAVPEPPNSLVFVCFLIFCLLAFLARKRLRPRATTGEGQICFVNS